MVKNYFPLHCHSDASLLDGLSKPEDIVARTEEIEAEGCALTDHGVVSNHIKFLQKMTKAKKKPLLGCEMYVSKDSAKIKNKENSKHAHMCIIAKDEKGWGDLIEAVSEANKPEHFYSKPRVDMGMLDNYGGRRNLMAFSGHIGSHMSNVLFDENKNLHPDWKNNGIALAEKLRDTFGKDNFFLEVQLMDSDAFPLQKTIAGCIREISQATGIPCVATQDAHYARKQDAEDQRVLICCNLGTTMYRASQPEFGMHGFFRSSQYHIPSYEEMRQWHTEEELDNTNLFASRIGEYKGILRSPVLPQYQCPGNQTPAEYLRHLCREGWKQKIQSKVNSADHARYAERVKHELSVINGAGLDSYFLIVVDILNFCRRQGWLIGPGRGSAAGSLVSYLVSITSIDPIPYDLIFERFYNAGRNTVDHISMPDIDMDIPAYARDHVIKYIMNKYGADHVGQMITFQTMKGRGAIKDVLRAYGGISFDEMNKITKNIIEEHKIADELQKMKEETGESSIIRWCLENRGDKLKDWCSIDEHGNLTGPLAMRFAQAIRMEGVKVNQSKHASGIIIAPKPIHQLCPMVLDTESGNMLAGLEMNDLEAIGGIKFDVLGLRLLDKAMGVSQVLKYGRVIPIDPNGVYT